MAKSSLGRYLTIGGVTYDPLELADSLSDAQLVVNEWFTIHCLVEIGEELADLLDDLVKGSSLQKGRPRLQGYTVDIRIASRAFLISVEPSTRDARIGLNIFELLDRGNAPAGGGDIKSNGSPMRFNPYEGNLVSVANGSGTNPVSFGTVSIGQDQIVGGHSVKPYEGRKLYQRTANNIDQAKIRRDLSSQMSLVKTISGVSSVDSQIRTLYRDIFNQGFRSNISQNRRRKAYTGILPFFPELIKKSKCKVTKRD